MTSAHESSDQGRPSVLLIDDDRDLCGLMREYLEQQGCAVSVAHDGREGLAAALSAGHDVVTLDVMLPVIDGFEVLRQLRRRSPVPVVMLTARGAAEDRINGLEAGADDYLPKPFNPGELWARIRAVLRRSSGQLRVRAEAIEAGGVRVSAATRQAWVGIELLQLTSVEFDLLDLLVRSAGRVVSRDQMSAVLYQREASPYERGVDVHVSHLRRKLQAAGLDRIRTVRGSGYLFEQT